MVLTTVSFSMEMTEILSLVPLVTKTYSSVATSELGLAPPTAGIPSTKAPTKLPVLVLAITSGFSGFATLIVKTENASGEFISPKPGIDMLSVSIPSIISLLPYANAGYFIALATTLSFVISRIILY